MSNAAQKQVLVLDGNTRAALAVVRSLGKAGYSVVVASEEAVALAAVSRYCCERIVSPPLLKETNNWRRWLLRLLRQRHFACLLPITDASLDLVLRDEAEIRSLTILPTIGRNTFETIHNKEQLLHHAEKLGLRIPRTLHIPATLDRSIEDVQAIRDFTYPAVLKPRSSSVLATEGFIRGDIHYVSSADQALLIVSGASDHGAADIPYLLQEHIEGRGVGYFALYKNGSLITSFAHRRILEKPPEGGRSVLSESISEQEAPQEVSTKLLSSLHWEGVAMVEFKETAKGEHVLMEINPRFWGSLQLAIDCGRDFPALLLESFLGDKSSIPTLLQTYEVGHRLRWELGCLDHTLIRIKKSGFLAIKDIVANNSLNLLSHFRKTSLEVARFSDFAPFVAESIQYIRSVFQR